MNILNDIITYGISNLWTSLLFLWLLHNLFEPTYKHQSSILVAGATILTTIINIFSTTIQINMVACLAVITLVSLFFRSRFQALFVGFYFFFSHLLIEDIVVIVFSLTGHITYHTAMYNGITMRIALMVIIEIAFLICLLIVKPRIKVIQESKRYFSYWSISFILVAISLLILHFTSINTIPDERISLIQLVNVIILFCIMHFLLVCLSSIIQFDIMKAENRQLQTISQYYADKITDSIRTQNNNQQLNHDLKKVFYAIQIMADKQDIEGVKEIAVSHSEKLSNSQEIKANTGISEIDDITNHLLGQLKEDVEYTFTSVVNESLKIDSRDCIVLLGNLLDNAIEAVQRVDSEKILNIKVTLDRNIFHVEIVNSYNGNLNYDHDGNLLTSKTEQSEHGYGLRSIVRIVERYNGTSDFVPIDSNMFSSSVILFQSRI